MYQKLSERFPEIPWNAFLRLHKDLPREGPGSEAATLRAIRSLPPLSSNPLIYDVGCGPGQQTLVLAAHFKCPIVAIDLVQPFLDTLVQRAAEKGMSNRIVPRCSDMQALDARSETVDLIWSEGSIYFVGFSKALALWRPLLKPGGCVVASEATWLTDDPADEAQQLFQEDLPDMTNVEGNVSRAIKAGYNILDHFVLPASAWWDEYYTPIQKRIERLRPQTATDADLAAVIAEAEHEIDIFRRFGSTYSYVFYAMQKRR